MIAALRELLQTILPRPVYRALLAPYHLFLSWRSANAADFPGQKLKVIAVTGTKGKSSVCEMIATILEEAGYTVAVSSTIRFSAGGESRPNLFKMTLPGRGFVQRLLRDAVRSGAQFAVIETTSEAALQYRHLFLFLDALVFTNLQKEHLESHGGMENYFKAKYRIGKALEDSPKRPRTIVANADDVYGKRFLTLNVEQQLPFSFADATNVHPTGTGITFSFDGTRFELPIPGEMNVMNALAAARVASAFGVPTATSAAALAKLSRIPGRVERIECGQDFAAVVDYAHTADSLEALYAAFPGRKICVLGNTGGGRDTWKRPLMAQIAERACAEVILTDEDPYDEDPKKIVDEMAAGMTTKPHIIMDRREAIHTALTLAKSGDAVLISGKGTDPCIMRAHGAKEAWSDATVVREELEKLRNQG